MSIAGSDLASPIKKEKYLYAEINDLPDCNALLEWSLFSSWSVC